MTENNKKYNKVSSYVFLHAILFQLSLGGILSKFASQQKFLSFPFIALYGLMILNLGIYAILWQQVIKRMPLTTAFSNKAVSIIWGIIWGVLIFRETIKWNMILGAVIVMCGVILVVMSDD